MKTSAVQRFVDWMKNILILGLASLCLYQTMNLWFGDISVFSFFSPAAAASYDYDSIIQGLAKPRRLLVTADGSEYLCKYTGIEDMEQYQAARQVITNLLETGRHRENETLEDIDWRRLLNGKALILDYGYLMPAKAFTAAFLSKSVMISQQIKVFDMVVILPSAEATTVVFADTLSQLKTVSYFVIDGFSLEADLPGDGFERNLCYVASEQLGLSFGRLVFIPQSYDGGIDYISVRPYSYFEDSVISVQSVRRLVETFFNNPDMIRNDNDGDVFTFSDENTVVRYVDGRYMEYSNWKSDTNKQISSFEDAYAEAVAFMAKDTSLPNEVYLSHYAYDGSTYTFSFNYAVNDLPVRLVDDIWKELQIDGAVEITVARDRVKHYKRYSQGFTASNLRSGELSVDYLSIMGELLKIGVTNAFYDEINAMELVYNVEQSNNPNLAVIVTLADRVISIPIKEWNQP